MFHTGCFICFLTLMNFFELLKQSLSLIEIGHGLNSKLIYIFESSYSTIAIGPWFRDIEIVIRLSVMEFQPTHRQYILFFVTLGTDIKIKNQRKKSLLAASPTRKNTLHSQS